MDKISRAISSIESGRLFSYRGDDLDSIIWYDLDTKSPISKEDIQTAINGLDIFDKIRINFHFTPEQNS